MRAQVMAAMEALRPPYSPRWVAALVVCALLIPLWIATWERVRFEKAEAIAATEQANRNLAIAYEENTSNAIENVEQLLVLMQTEYLEEGASVSAAMAQWPLDRNLVRGLAVAGRDGARVVAGGEALGAPGELREAFEFHREHRDTALRIGSPRQITLDGVGQTRLAISRRVVRQDGSFGGALLAIVDPTFFTHFFERAEVDPGSVVELAALDGFAIARQAGHSTTFATDMRSSTLFSRLASAPTGSFMSRGALEGIPRLTSYRRLARFPLVVMVGSPLEGTLAPVRERARLYYVLLASASALIALGALGLLGAVQRHQRDFEALRAAEAKLREAAARTHAISENMAGGVVIAALDGTILGANRAACEMHGYAAEELIGEPLARLIAEADRAPFLARLESARSDPAGTGHEVKEFRALRKDGSTFEAEVIGSIACFDGQANMVGIVHDISARKALERTLRRNEALFRATFDQALIGIVHTDMAGRFIRVNRKACEMLGYTEAEMLARGYRDVTHPEDFIESAGHHERLRANPKEPFEYQVTRRFLRKDGSILWTLASVGVIRDDDGMPEFFLTMVQDITELKKVEEMKNEFISTVSHELRSPLTSIRGSLGLLVGGVAGQLPKAAHDLAVIGERNCERLIRLVNDILDTERMEAGRMRFELQRADLASLAGRAVEAMQGYALGRSVSLRLVPPPRPLAAEVDADRFIQVLTNLVSNAVKFSPVGSTVEIALLEHGETARIEVRDHGPGIPREFRSRIFQRFSQADSSSTRAAGGTGLGLYIAKGIVERMGGSIGFDTSAAQGTTFHFELPLSAVSSPRAAQVALHA